MAPAESGFWDAAAVKRCPRIPWEGMVWRCHSRRYAGDSAAGSLQVTGRFNQGSDRFPASAAWPALYTSLGQHVALGERIRHTTPSSLASLANQRISQLLVKLQVVLDACAPTECAELGISGLTRDDICRPADYTKTHEIARVARQFAEALLIPSCTRFPEGNLIIFPDRLLPGSSISIVSSLDPDIFVDWDNIK